MSSQPTTVEAVQYHVQLEHNNNQATQLFTALFPEIEPGILMETLNIVQYLSQTRVNPQIIPRVIRGIHNIMIGTGRGQVIVHVQGQTTNVSVRETSEEEFKTKM